MTRARRTVLRALVALGVYQVLSSAWIAFAPGHRPLDGPLMALTVGLSMLATEPLLRWTRVGAAPVSAWREEPR